MEIPELFRLSGSLQWCLLILALAGFIHGVFGLGFAMIATPLLALLIDYRSAIFLSGLPLLVMALSFLLLHRKRVIADPMCRRAGPAIIAGSITGSIAGALLQLALSQRVSQALLAALLLLGAALPLILRHIGNPSRERVAMLTPLLGASAGLTDAALNVGAPFLVMLGAIARLGRFEQLLVLNVCFATSKLIQLSLLSVASPPTLPAAYFAAGVGVAYLAHIGGSRLAGRWHDEAFRPAVGAFQCVMAAALLFQAARG